MEGGESLPEAEIRFPVSPITLPVGALGKTILSNSLPRFINQAAE